MCVTFAHHRHLELVPPKARSVILKVLFRMANIFPFEAYRYAAKAGPLKNLITQPYDKISPEMRQRYLQASPYNLVRIILGERHESDSDSDNVYTRAANHLTDWIAEGVLAREAEPALFAYFQEFTVPDSGERLVRKGFIGLGAVEEYSANIVHRHEQTLSGPKKDRLELLRHTHAHFGQLFMLYPDPAGEIDRILEEAAQAAPTGDVTDEYGDRHTFWKISTPAAVARITHLMAGKKLLIADGHHRYETALAFRRDNPTLPGADRVMMTFVNMHAPGLKILATHRLVSGVPNFDAGEFIRQAAAGFEVAQIPGTRSAHARVVRIPQPQSSSAPPSAIVSIRSRRAIPPGNSMCACCMSGCSSCWGSAKKPCATKRICATYVVSNRPWLRPAAARPKWPSC